ncbi:hypothetical protein BC835DRAFT_593222 [Cytidiella melzeri]|nr:hypothetical protein BC835DRAFT_593222 [Cytidiella melzeri]
MPTEIIIPHRHRSRRHSAVSYGTGAYPGQTYVTGPDTGVQYPVANTMVATPVTTTSYLPSTTPFMPTTTLAPQPVAYPPTAVQAVTPAPAMVAGTIYRPFSAPPMAGMVGTYSGYTSAYDPYADRYGTRYDRRYGEYDTGYKHRARYSTGYDGRYRDDARYDENYNRRYHHSAEYDGSGYNYPPTYPGGSAANYYDAQRPPINQRIAGDLEQLGGWLADSEEMTARGHARRVGVTVCTARQSRGRSRCSCQAGVPVIPLTAQHAARRGAVGYGGGRYVPGVGPTYY